MCMLSKILVTDGAGDFDLTDGVILDPGGPAYYEREVGGEVFQVDKLALLAPYLFATLDNHNGNSHDN